MIELTDRLDGKKALINITLAEKIYQIEEGCSIQFYRNVFHAKESYEQVKAMINHLTP